MKLNFLQQIYSFTWEISWDLWEIWYELGQREGGGGALVGKANLKIDDYRCGKSTVMNTAGFAKCKTFKNLSPKYCQVLFFSVIWCFTLKVFYFTCVLFPPRVLSFSLSRRLLRQHSFTAACEMFTASNRIHGH